MESAVIVRRKQRDSALAHRAHARTLAQLRTMTDTERARWVQSVLPQHYVECPACEGDGCLECVDTGRMSKAGARAWLAEHESTSVMEGGRDEAPVWR